MAIQRKYTDNGATVTVVEEQLSPVVEAHADATTGESEVVSRSIGPADVAQSWVRFMQAIFAFGLLVAETALTFRLVFALGAANAANGFVSFIYDVTGPLVAPFEGIAAESASGTGVFEPETLIAMTVYFFAAMLVIAFVGLALAAPTPHKDVVTRERHTTYDGHV